VSEKFAPTGNQTQAMWNQSDPMCNPSDLDTVIRQDEDVAHLRCDFFSEALGLSTSMTVLLPQRTSNQIGMVGTAVEGPAPVLYLLHGLSDDDTIWVRRTSIERYVAASGLAVVMPQVHRSFYTDEAYGGRYWTFLSEELPSLVGSMFRVSNRRADTFVAGLSMGGYGALRWALRQPERFAAVASLSGVVDVAALLHGREQAVDPRLFERVFGTTVPADLTGTDNDLVTLLTQAQQAGRDLPALYLCCGTNEQLITQNRAFAWTCTDLNVPVQSSFSPGHHDWDYWDAKIQDVLAWLPLPRQDQA
jgi:putative tributyrin esterase